MEDGKSEAQESYQGKLHKEKEIIIASLCDKQPRVVQYASNTY